MGLIDGLSNGAFLVLLLTGIMMWIRTQVQQTLSETHEYHREGVGFCLVTLSALMSAFALQISTTEDLFPGAPELPPNMLPGLLSNDIASQRTALLFVLFALTVGMTLFTVNNSKAIQSKRTLFPIGLAILNFTSGAIILGSFVLLLVVRA